MILRLLLLGIAVSGVLADSCREEDVVGKVTKCAKASPDFLRCVSAGVPGSEQQCECIRNTPDVMKCVSDCWTQVHDALCVQSWSPAKSKFLTYKATKQTLKGIDGAYVINLQRRPDRLKKFFDNSKLTPEDIHVQQAFDGKELSWTPGIEKLFKNNKFGRRRALVGQALSHFLLWRHIASTSGQYHLIFEDDTTFTPNFIEEWNNKYYGGFPLRADIVFLGGVTEANQQAFFKSVQRETRTFSRNIKNKYFVHSYDEGVDFGEKGAESLAFFYKPSAYIISSQAAKDLVEFIAQHGFVQPVPVTLMKMMRKWEQVWTSHPLVCPVQPLDPTLAGGADSDIADDTTPVPDPEPEPVTPPTPPPVQTPPPPAQPQPQPSPPAKAQPKLSQPALNHFGFGNVATYVINLNSSKDRLDAFEAQARRAHIKYHRFSATDGQHLDTKGLKDRGLVSPDYNVKLKGTIGQFLSHMLLWEAVSETDWESVLVFEDNAEVPEDFLRTVDEIVDRNDKSWEVLALGCDLCSQGINESKSLAPVSQCSLTTRALLVKRSAAERMLRSSIPITSSVREFLAANADSFSIQCARSPVVKSASVRPDRVPRDEL